MVRIKLIINKLTNLKKVNWLILILIITLLLVVGIPSLARFKNRNISNAVTVWNGSVAGSYKEGDGTENDPYVISNGAELAYFSSQLVSNNYENKYFVLGNDIILNAGLFNYNTNNNIEYILDSQTYYIDKYTNKYYDNENMSGTESGTVNILNSLDSFKGHFDGSSYRIRGLYITDESSDNLGLFTNLQGDVHDLYVENAMVYGGIVTGGIASNTDNALLSNIFIDGIVVGKDTNLDKNSNTSLSNVVLDIKNIQTNGDINLINNIPLVGKEIISTSITGNYTISGASAEDTTIKVNGITVNNGSFNINLGTTILDSIPVTTITTSNEGSVTLSNLSYNVDYKYGVASGIVAKQSNTNINNVINKANVYGYSVSGGLVGVTTNQLIINQSYNNGNINSQYVSGGLIGVIENSSDNITISNSYNTGDMIATDIGGIIGIIKDNSGSIGVSSVFNTSTSNYCIGTIESATVNVSDGYYVNGTSAINQGTVTGSFTKTSLDNLKSKAYVIDNLSYNEFVSFDDVITNNSNVWIYEKDGLPILFIDDANHPIANINVSSYSWNNLSDQLSTVLFESNITFNIEELDELVPIKEAYYYISESNAILTKAQLAEINSWTSYSDIVQITEEGQYIVYVKIVDYDDDITYLNTDILNLNFPGPSGILKFGNSQWKKLRSDLNYNFIDRSKTLNVEAIDELSSIKYYITNEILTTNDLDQLNDNVWMTYSNEISVDEIGTNIVYVKLVDAANEIRYINSDYIVLNGYTENDLIIGRNASSYIDADSYITNNSSFTLNFNYSASVSNSLDNTTHNLMSNLLLPLGTKITLIDNATENVYEYKIPTSDDNYNYNNSCSGQSVDCIKIATYPFTLFKEVGATDKYYQEKTYYNNGTVNENFTIIVDFSNANITTNYQNVALYPELHDTNGNNIRPTLFSTIKKINIYYNVGEGSVSGDLYLNTDYNGNEIEYNINSTTNININSGLTYKSINGYDITDTTYEDKEIGLAIKLVDSNSNIVSKDHLKNMIFKIGDNIYYPEKDNIVHINLENGFSNVNKTLTIITNENNNDLNEGLYYFKINNYASYDGYYYESNDLGNDELTIPVRVVSNSLKVTYSFDVIMNDDNRIISKNNPNTEVLFNILQNGSLSNPNIRVTLYKKQQLTAYNQNYSIVDLQDYVSDSLNIFEPNIYYVAANPVQYNDITKLYNSFELNLITANLDNTGYKFVFYLYDGNKKIGTIEKYIIVR
jgi:hypothetical protein